MGLAGLTAVFGMGTGVTPPVWSPEKRPAGGQAGPGALCGSGFQSAATTPRLGNVFVGVHPASRARQAGLAEALGSCSPLTGAVVRRTDRGGQAIGC